MMTVRVVFTFDPLVQYSLNTDLPLVTDEYLMNNFKCFLMFIKPLLLHATQNHISPL